MRKIILAVLLAFHVDVSAAAILSSDLGSAGDGLVTRDTQTGLEWLDVTATVGQSRAAVLSGSYVTQQGFRFATADEVLALWMHAGASGPFTNNNGIGHYVGNFDAANLLIGLMGCTSIVLGNACDGVDQNWHIAFFGDSPTEAALVDAFGPPHIDAGKAAMWIDFGPTVDILNRIDVGSYLVREIPEPRSAWLFMVLALAAIAWPARRRCRAKSEGRRNRGYRDLSGP